VARIIRERGVGIVVFGLPVHDDPAQAREVKRFARKLRAGLKGLRCRFVDETLTTAEASAMKRASGLRRGKSRQDDLAAALILESFLEQTTRMARRAPPPNR